MTEPHERIWAFEPDIFDNCSIWQDVPSPKNDATEYIRADHVDALLKQARDDALREAAEIAIDYGKQQYIANVKNQPQYADDIADDAQEIAGLILALIENKNPGS